MSRHLGASLNSSNARFASVRNLAGRLYEAPVWAWAGAFGLLALIVRIPLFLSDFSAVPTPDTGLYLQIVDGLPASLDTEAFRTVGYPLFLAPLSLIPGETFDAGVVAQHLLGIALVAAVFVLTDRWFGRAAGLLAALITTVAPQMMFIEHFVLPDLVFGVVVFAGAALLIEASVAQMPSVRLLIAAGVLFAAAAHIKPTAQMLVFVPFVVVGFATRSWREALRGGAVVAGAMAVLIVPWVLHNAIRHDQPTMSVQGGQALWLRLFDQDKEPIPTDTDEGRLADELFREYMAGPPVEQGYAPNPAQLPVTESYSYVFAALIEEGYSILDAIEIQQDLAIEAIVNDPVSYLDGTASNLATYARYNAVGEGFEAADLVARQQIAAVTGVERKLSTAAWKLAALMGKIGLVLTLGLVAVLLLPFVGSRPARIAAVTLMLVWAAIAIAGALTASVEPRYAAEIAVEQWILEAAAVVFVASAVYDRFRGSVRDGVGGPERPFNKPAPVSES